MEIHQLCELLAFILPVRIVVSRSFNTWRLVSLVIAAELSRHHCYESKLLINQLFVVSTRTLVGVQSGCAIKTRLDAKYSLHCMAALHTIRKCWYSSTLACLEVFFSLIHAPLDVIVHVLVYLRSFMLKSFLSRFSPFVAQIKNFCSDQKKYTDIDSMITAVLKVVIIESMSVSSLLMMVRGAMFTPDRKRFLTRMQSIWLWCCPFGLCKVCFLDALWWPKVFANTRLLKVANSRSLSPPSFVSSLQKGPQMPC